MSDTDIDKLEKLVRAADTFMGDRGRAATNALVFAIVEAREACERLRAGRAAVCPWCKGKGYVSGDPEGAPIEDCQKCRGTGEVANPMRAAVWAECREACCAALQEYDRNCAHIQIIRAL